MFVFEIFVRLFSNKRDRKGFERILDVGLRCRQKTNIDKKKVFTFDLIFDTRSVVCVPELKETFRLELVNFCDTINNRFQKVYLI